MSKARWLLAALLVASLSAQAEGRPVRHGGQTKAKQDERGGHGAAGGKVAVFAFDGDERTNVRKRVVLALMSHGLQVDTSLRPGRTVREFRDIGNTLRLAAYVHGHIRDRPGDKAEANITVRSGVTGKPIARATIAGYRDGLGFGVEEELWQRVGKAIVRACRDARKPRRLVHAMHIEAGVPL
ncbi:MAG: hypothetical protein ABSB49_07120 [Polyangia bacterium]